MNEVNGPSGVGRPHLGHFMALGESLGKMLSEKGMSHKALTSEHVLWVEEHGVLGIVGWGNAREIKWPEQALEHRTDLAVLLDDFGPYMTAAVRLGYVFNLGPVGELIFYCVARGKAPVGAGKIYERLTRQWAAPPDNVGLNDNSLLDGQRFDEISHVGVKARHAGSLDVALQAFLRCMIAGIAEANPQMQMISAMNMATIYIDYERWLRAYGSTLIALLSALRMEDQKPEDLTEKMKQNLGVLSQRCNESEIELIDQLVSSGEGISVVELMWKIADIEIDSVLGVG